MRIYDFQEYQRYHRVAREFGWSMREYKEVIDAVDSLFDDLEFKSDPDSHPPKRAAEEQTDKRADESSGDSASAQT